MKGLKTIATCLMLSSSSIAMAGNHGMQSQWMNFKKDFMDWKLRPYAGLGLQHRAMGWESGYGSGHLHKDRGQMDVFAGLKFNKFVGLELGYEDSGKKEAVSRIQPSEVVFGEGQSNGDSSNESFIVLSGQTPSRVRFKSRIEGMHYTVNLFAPVWKRGCTSFDLFGHLGSSQLKMTAEHIQLDDPATGLALNHKESENTQLKFKAKHWAFRAGAGVQATFKKHYGVRLSVNWEDTNKFRLYQEDPMKEAAATRTVRFAQAKNSVSTGLGFFFIY